MLNQMSFRMNAMKTETMFILFQLYFRVASSSPFLWKSEQYVVERILVKMKIIIYVEVTTL